MIKDRKVNATFQQPSAPPPPPPPPKPKFTLTVAVTGPGTVASTTAGILCGTDCTQDYDQGAVVTLAPLTSSGARFIGWGVACTGTGLCVVTMDASKSVTAKFLMQGARPPETRPLPNAGDVVNQVTVDHPYKLIMRFLCYSRSELFLTNLYRDVLGRAIDPVSLALLGPKLSAGMPPKEAALGRAPEPRVPLAPDRRVLHGVPQSRPQPHRAGSRTGAARRRHRRREPRGRAARLSRDT